MDLQNAALLALGIFIFMEAVKLVAERAGHPLPSWTIIPLAFVAAFAIVFWAAETVWAHDQVIGGKNLDTLDTASKAFSAFVLGGAAAGIDKGLDAVKNIGQNQNG